MHPLERLEVLCQWLQKGPERNGTVAGMEQAVLSAVFGGAHLVGCLLTVAMGIYMIRRANREIKKIKEKDNG